MDLLWQDGFYALTPASFGRRRRSPLLAPPPASGRQMVTEAGRHHTDQRVTVLNTPSHTGTNLLVFIRKGFSSCAGLGKLCCSVTDLFAYRPQ